MKAYMNKDYGTAILFYKGVLETDSDNCSAINNLGASYTAKGDLDSALQVFLKMVNVCPDEHGAHFWLGETYYYLGQAEQSYVEFRKFLDLEPESIDDVTHFLAERYDELTNDFTLSDLEFLYTLSPRIPLINRELSKRYWQRRQIFRAVYHYLRSILIRPK